MANQSHAHGINHIPLKGETISACLRQTVEKFGRCEALVVVSQNYRATYDQLWSQVEEVAKSLLAYGIKKYDRVGIWAPNRYEWILVQFATARVGAIMVNINPAYKTADLKYALEQSKVELLIAAHYFRKTDYVEMLNHVRPDCEYPHRTIIIEKHWEKFIEAGEKISDEALHDIEDSL